MTRLTAIILAATLLLMIGLKFGGPFFDPICPKVEYIAGDGRLVTLTGIFDASAHVFRSEKKGGYLIYGPYISLNRGSYTVSWSGTAHNESHPQFEVFSQANGMLAIETHPIPPTNGDVVLNVADFRISENIDGLQFRVLADASDELEISGVTLECRTH